MNAFNDYPWGNLVWDKMRKGLLKVTTNAEIKIKIGNNCYHLSGFSITLQVFAYKILPELSQRYTRKLDVDPFPLECCVGLLTVSPRSSMRI